MISETFEQDLREYAKRQCNQLFIDKLNEPLTYLVKWLFGKQTDVINKCDYEDIFQMVMVNILKGIKSYNPNKNTTAITFVRMLIFQEIVRCKKVLYASSKTDIEYNPALDYRVHENTAKTIDQYVNNLKEFITTIDCIEERKVIAVIIKSFEKGSLKDCQRPAMIKKIGREAGVSGYLVKKVLRKIKEQRFYLGDKD